MENYLRIAVLIGSVRKASLNRKLAHLLEQIAPPGLRLQEIEIHELPLYSEEDDVDQHRAVRRLKVAVAAADGVLFVTPEYNRSIPGVLKNAIDHGSRPYGNNSWAGTPAGIVGISMGAFGTAMAQQHLRNILAFLDMPTLGQPEVFLKSGSEFFHEDGLASPENVAFLSEWMDIFARWVRQHRSL